MAPELLQNTLMHEAASGNCFSHEAAYAGWKQRRCTPAASVEADVVGFQINTERRLSDRRSGSLARLLRRRVLTQQGMTK